MPLEINYIDRYAFSNCESLEELNIPKDESRENLMIAGWAFEKCTNLRKVYLGDGMEVSLEEDVFIDCINLADVSGNHNIYMFDSSFENTKVMNSREDADFFCIDNCLIQYLGKAKDVVLPERIDEICKYAFNYGAVNKSIDSIHIPESVTYLDLDYDISYTSEPDKKIKLYFGKPVEFNVSDSMDAKGNFIFVAPKASLAIKYAQENGIEYIIEE